MRAEKSPVRIIGAGPGDPDLLTVKAVRYLRRADVIYHDALIHELVLSLSNPDSRKVCVGHRAGHKGPLPGEIARQIADDYRRGFRVVRLKAGDPVVFARLVEETRELDARGVPYEIIPGVTSAIAVPGYAGIPLTARDLAAGFTVECGTRAGGSHGISAVAGDGESLTRVFLMPGRDLGPLVRSLYRQGYTPSTPAALIGWGTTPRQRVLIDSLEMIHRRQGEIPAGDPKMLVVGRAVALRFGTLTEASGFFRGRVIIPWLRGLGRPPWRSWWRRGFEPVLWIPGRLEPDVEGFRILIDELRRGRKFRLRIETLLTARMFLRGLRALSIDLRRLTGIPIEAGGRAGKYLLSRGIVPETRSITGGHLSVLTLVNPLEAFEEGHHAGPVLPVARIALNPSLPPWPEAEWIDGRYPGLLRVIRNLIDPSTLVRSRVIHRYEISSSSGHPNKPLITTGRLKDDSGRSAILTRSDNGGER